MRALLAFALFASCTSDTATDTGQDDAGPPPVVTIVLPESDQVYAWEDTIEVEVAVKRGKEEVAFRSVVWSVGGETIKGETASIKAQAVGAGDHEVSVELYVGDDKYTESVDIVVEEEIVDTGVGPGSTHYEGTMATHVWYDGDFGSFDADCPGTVTFDVSEEGVMSGTGWCLLDGEYDMYYVIEGQQNGAGISGTLIAEQDGEEVRTPFTGTGRAGETMTANYDKTFNDSGESVRIAGTFTADPVAPPQ